MKRPLVVGFITALSGFGIGSPHSGFAATPKDDAVLNQARQAYYSLHKEGLVSFACNLNPDWRLMLKGLKPTSDQYKKAYASLQQLHFSMSMAANGVVTTKHNNPSWTRQKLKAFNQITSGMQQMVSGVFETWKMFMLDPPLPQPGTAYQLTLEGSQYRLHYKEGTTDVVTTIAPTYAINEIVVTTSEFKSSVQPKLQKTKKGFVLAGYIADYKSHNAAETTHLNITFRDHSAQGFELIRWMHVDAIYGGSPSTADVSFTNCHTTRKH